MINSNNKNNWKLIKNLMWMFFFYQDNSNKKYRKMSSDVNMQAEKVCKCF